MAKVKNTHQYVLEGSSFRHLLEKFSKEVYSYIDSACSKGVIHKNNASRKVGRLASALYKAKATATVETKVEVKTEVKEEKTAPATEEVKPVKKTTRKTATKKAE